MSGYYFIPQFIPYPSWDAAVIPDLPDENGVIEGRIVHDTASLRADDLLAVQPAMFNGHFIGYVFR